MNQIKSISLKVVHAIVAFTMFVIAKIKIAGRVVARVFMATSINPLVRHNVSGETMKIVIERHPNPDITTYHLDRRLTLRSQSSHFMSNNDVVQLSQIFSYNETAEPFALSIAEAIYKIDGVDGGDFTGGVSIGPYNIRVSKGKAFTDSQIESSVIDAIAQIFGLNRDNVVITTTVPGERYTRRYDLVSR